MKNKCLQKENLKLSRVMMPRLLLPHWELKRPQNLRIIFVIFDIKKIRYLLDFSLTTISQCSSNMNHTKASNARKLTKEIWKLLVNVGEKIERKFSFNFHLNQQASIRDYKCMEEKNEVLRVESIHMSNFVNPSSFRKIQTCKVKVGSCRSDAVAATRTVQVIIS